MSKTNIKVDVHHITRVEGHGNIKVDISNGEIRPIVRINDKSADELEELYIYSPWRYICGCGSIEYGLDDIENARKDRNKDCVIM